MSKTRKSRAAQPPEWGGRKILFAVIAFLSLAGVVDALYLTVAHLTGETAICGQARGCMTVLNSSYAKIGPLPLAGFGLVAYFGAFALATFTAFDYGRLERFLRMVVWIMFSGTVWLLFVQAVLLKSYCRFCLLSAAITFLIAGLLIATPKREPR